MLYLILLIVRTFCCFLAPIIARCTKIPCYPLYPCHLYKCFSLDRNKLIFSYLFFIVFTASHISYIIQQKLCNKPPYLVLRECTGNGKHIQSQCISWQCYPQFVSYLVSLLCIKFGKQLNSSMNPEFFLYSYQVKNMEHITIFCKQQECAR